MFVAKKNLFLHKKGESPGLLQGTKILEIVYSFTAVAGQYSQKTQLVG